MISMVITFIISLTLFFPSMGMENNDGKEIQKYTSFSSLSTSQQATSRVTAILSCQYVHDIKPSDREHLRCMSLKDILNERGVTHIKVSSSLSLTPEQMHEYAECILNPTMLVQTPNNEEEYTLVLHSLETIIDAVLQANKQRIDALKNKISTHSNNESMDSQTIKNPDAKSKSSWPQRHIKTIVAFVGISSITATLGVQWLMKHINKAH